MTKLGFEPESLARFEQQILKPYGMVLVTGPTGSGKTNTLYSSVARLNTTDTNIMTAEDPVEFQLAGVNQVQMKEQIGLNFASALRAFLRQDPNIILVGEIRDFETAEIAVKAALTGHLVLSTLHTNDAPSTDQPFDEHGHRAFSGGHLGEPDLRTASRAANLRAVQGGSSSSAAGPDRRGLLTGRVYESHHSTRARLRHLQQHRDTRAVSASMRSWKSTDELRELILVGASALELKKKALELGMITLRRSGLIKVAAGQTTMEEVVRETVL